jgi:hypothetical protein
LKGFGAAAERSIETQEVPLEIETAPRGRPFAAQNTRALGGGKNRFIGSYSPSGPRRSFRRPAAGAHVIATYLRPDIAPSRSPRSSSEATSPCRRFRRLGRHQALAYVGERGELSPWRPFLAVGANFRPRLGSVAATAGGYRRSTGRRRQSAPARPARVSVRVVAPGPSGRLHLKAHGACHRGAALHPP